MKNQPFRTILNSFQKLHVVVFVGLPIALLLTLALSWGGLRIINQEKEKVGLDFFAISTYLNSQQKFLHRFQQRNHLLPNFASIPAPNKIEAYPNPKNISASYLVHPSTADIPYSLFCFDSSACPMSNNIKASPEQVIQPLHPLGNYLSDYYAAHWARSYFPGAYTILFDENLTFALMVPALETSRDSTPYSHATVPMLTQAMHALTQQQIITDSPHWIALPDLPNTIASVVDVSFPENTWSAPNGTTPKVYAITTFNLELTNLFRNISENPIYDKFWLQNKEGETLVGSEPIPGPYPEGIELTSKGVVLTFTDSTKNWTGIYQISYLTVLQANPWLPGATLTALLLSLALGFAYVRWYGLRVIRPAQTAQQALIDSESFNRTLLNTAPVALCMITQETEQLLFCNPLARQWLEIDDVMLGQPLSLDFLPSHIFHTNTAGTYDFLTSNGHFLQMVYSPTRYHNQSVVLCAFIDISARIQYEQALATAKAEADSANTAKSRFLAAVSHEIRTPLYGILGTLELLQMTPLNDGQHQHLTRLQQSSSALMQLISDILDFTKVEADQLALNLQPLDPRVLVQSCANDFSAAARHKGVLLFACIDTDTPPCVLGDAHRIRQIINNLLSNALKFTASGQIIVRLRSQPNGKDASTLTFQVVDSGIGISKANQEKLATPFFQVTDVTQMPQGTGLGLSICTSLAELMGGHIDITSEQGLGSSFSLSVTLPHAADEQLVIKRPDLTGLNIYIRSPHSELSENLCQWLRRWQAQAFPVLTRLPEHSNTDDILVDILNEAPAVPENWKGHYVTAGLAVPPNKSAVDVPYAIEGYSALTLAQGVLDYLYASQNPDNTRPARAKKFTPLGLHLLVVEDNPINLAMLNDQLAQLGCTTVLTHDGKEALNHWNTNTFDAVITDVNMPNLNGYELTQALRQMGINIPIIGVTANAMRDEENRCRAAGMSAWLVKPINLHTLYYALKELVPTPLSKPAAITALNTLPLPNTNLKKASEDLKLIPEKYRSLFRETMLADAKALTQTALEKNEPTLRNTLHRIQGALVTMKQNALAARVQEVQDYVHSGNLETACEVALNVAKDLETLTNQTLSL